MTVVTTTFTTFKAKCPDGSLGQSFYYLEPNSHCKSKEAFWAEQDPVREIHPHLREDKEHYLAYIMVHLGDVGITPESRYFIKRAQAGDTKKKSPIQLKYLVSKQLLCITMS